MDITPAIVRELLHYDPVTGIFTWKARDRGWFKSERGYKTWHGRYAGKRAGYLFTEHRCGYQTRRLKVAGVPMLEHRAAWMWMTGEEPPEEIDHENRDATDNRWENLKASSHSDNMLNMSRYRTNKSGFPGVFWYAKLGRWSAYGRSGGRQHHLGYFYDYEDAVKASRKFRANAGYSRGHGKQIAAYIK
jgi:hypothetical protein